MPKRHILCMFISLFVIGSCISGCIKSKDPKESNEEGSPIVFRLAETMPATHPSALGVQRFASLVEERSAGRIKVQVYYENELGTPKQILEQLQFGGIAMARVNVLELTETVSSLQHYFKPQAYENGDTLMEWIQENQEKLSDHCQMERLVPLVWYYPDIRCFYSDDQVIQKVSDLKNMKVKTTPSIIMRQTMEALECVAVETITADTYKSLSSGYMDGGETTLGELVLSDYYSFINCMTLSEYISCPDTIVVSSIEFSLLEISDRELIVQCAKDTYEYQKSKTQEFQKHWIAELEKYKQLLIEDKEFKKDMETIFNLEEEVTFYE